MPQPESTALPHIALPKVSWQTLFWIITTLAINSMTQPCGWVCGFNSRYRIYIRSSPIICVVDIVLMLYRWLEALFKPGPTRLNIRESFYMIVIDRFRGNEPSEGIQTIGNSTGIRWFLFVMGPLPQKIRLASFQGVYWSKGIGFSFLGSWLLMEIALLARALSSRHLESRETLYGGSDQRISDVLHAGHGLETSLCVFLSYVSIVMLLFASGTLI
ncbi:hypothetical protein IFR05_000139 [Cadophora sp. M221]|nr:hypothetical protein IFR05_000139 [Cadophora sp. M221]